MGLDRLAGHDGAVASIAVTPDGSALVSAGDDAHIRLRSLKIPVLSPTQSLARAQADFGWKLDGMVLRPDPEQFKTSLEAPAVSSANGGLPPQTPAARVPTW